MPILTEDVKLMASQRLTDNDDGGGRMTGVEIVDGNVNNLFPDISRLDRVYGRVSLRKAFVSVQTADTDTYSGAHVILSLPAKDPNVSVCMFNTGDPNDERTEARDRLESYVTIGPRYQGWLWGDQPAGSRSLLLFQARGLGAPDIGSVLCLFKDKGLATEVQQFVRVTKSELVTSEFTSGEASSFKRDTLTLEIGDPLRVTFPGIEISSNDSLPTNIYTTTVSDASKYYGVMLPTAAVEAGDIAINVDTIYAHLVPSAQGEAPMVDLSVGEAGPVIGAGETRTIPVSTFTVVNGAQLHFCRGIKPKTLKIIASAHTYSDDGNGILTEGSNQLGTVDYSTGTITFANLSSSYSSALSMSAVIGVEVPRIPNSKLIYVELANQGFNYTTILDPLLIPGSLAVDFMSQGKWYRLRDDGNGFLVPDIDKTGTGSVNYNTGSVVLTCGALPDVETAIIYSWGSPIETVDLSGVVDITMAEVNHTLASHPVNPGTLSITWPVGAMDTGTATDDGAGAITGDATGTINYQTGEISFTPSLLPVSGGEYEIDYDKYPDKTGTANVTGIGILSFTLPEGPIKPGTVAINFPVNFSGGYNVYRLVDDGVGGLSAPGFELAYPVYVNGQSWLNIYTPRRQDGSGGGAGGALIRGGGPGNDNYVGNSGENYDGQQLFYTRPHLNNNAAYTIRGFLPGFYYPCHPYTSFSQFQQLTADNKTFLNIAHNVYCGNGTAYGCYFIQLDDWRA